MKFPKKIYAILPYGSDGKIAGVYVGVTKNIKTRMANHLYDYSSLQTELHNLMRENGFSYLVLGEAPHYRDGYLEYDWIDFFLKRTNLRVFNKSVGLCGANFNRAISRVTLEEAKTIKSALEVEIPLEELFEQTT